MYEGEESKLNDIGKLLEENCPKLRKDSPIVITEAYKTLNRQDQERKQPQYITIKTLSIKNKNSVLKAARENTQVTD